MLENLIAKWFYRPSDFKEERWRFLKKTLFVVGIPAFGSGVVIGRHVISDSASSLPIVLVVLAILTVGIFLDQIGKERKRLKYERWWRGEVSKWSIFWIF